MPVKNEQVEQIAKRAKDIYERSIRQVVEGEHDGRIVAIETESGDYELGDTVLEAARKLESRHPGKNASFFMARVGTWAVYSIGGSSLKWKKA